MLSARQWVGALAVVLICAGFCAATVESWRHRDGAGSDGHASRAMTSSNTLTGRWEGAWHSAGAAAGGSLGALLTQTGTSLAGTATILDTACFTDGAVSGEVNENIVVFGAVFANEAQASFDGTVLAGGMTIEGVYNVIVGKCLGDQGSWRLDKIVDPCDANGDGTIDRQDACDLLRFLLGVAPALSGNADCDQDGAVDFRDVIAIFKH
jgi:hypothetical protein